MLNSAINLSKSFIQYSYTIPGLAGSYTLIYEDGSDLFSRIQFGSQSGEYAVDLSSYADRYHCATRCLKTKLTDLLDQDQNTGLYPCRQDATRNLHPHSLDGLTNGTANAGSVSHLEPQHLIIAPTPGTSLTVNRMFPLGSIKDTLFEQDKNILLKTESVLRIYTQLLTRIGFYTTTPGTPSIAANYTAFTSSAVTLNNVYAFFAVDENAQNVALLRAAVEAGRFKMSVPFPFVYSFTVSPSNSSASNNVTLSKGFGRAIKKLIFVPFDGAADGTAPTAYAHSNVNGACISTISTQMDGSTLQDNPLNCYNPWSSLLPTGTPFSSYPQNIAEDYRAAASWLPYSCAGLSYPHYQSQWHYIDQWGVNDARSKPFADETQINDGFDVYHSGNHQYSVQGSITATSTRAATVGLLCLIIVVYNRTLMLSNEGIKMGF